MVLSAIHNIPIYQEIKSRYSGLEGVACFLYVQL